MAAAATTTTIATMDLRRRQQQQKQQYRRHEYHLYNLALFYRKRYRGNNEDLYTNVALTVSRLFFCWFDMGWLEFHFIFSFLCVPEFMRASCFFFVLCFALR